VKGYMSITEMSEKYGLSRATVWRRVKTLKSVPGMAPDARGVSHRTNFYSIADIKPLFPKK